MRWPLLVMISPTMQWLGLLRRYVTWLAQRNTCDDVRLYATTTR